jgi:hypothetical protein
MKKLKMLEISNVVNFSPWLSKARDTLEWHGDPLNFMLSNELCVMNWWGYPLESLPTNFQSDNLVELIMHYSFIKQPWDGRKVSFWPETELRGDRQGPWSPPKSKKKKYRLYCFNFFLTGPPPPPQFFLLADVRYYFALLFVLHLKIDQGYLCLLKFSITLLPLFSLRLSKHFYGLLGISPSIPIISHSSLPIHPFLNIVSPSLFLSRSLFLRKRRRFHFSFRRCA